MLARMTCTVCIAVVMSCGRVVGLVPATGRCVLFAQVGGLMLMPGVTGEVGDTSRPLALDVWVLRVMVARVGKRGWD